MNEVVEGNPFSSDHMVEGYPLSGVSETKIQFGIWNGAACVSGNWGVPYPVAKRAELVAQRFGIDVEKTLATASASGFHTTWNYPYGHPSNLAYREELGVIEIGVDTALSLQGWKRDEVGAVIVASSSPRELNYAARIAEYLGLSYVDIMNFYLACNSYTQALGYALTNMQLLYKKVLIVGVDGLGSQVNRISPDLTDHLAPIFFGNGFFITALKPGKHLRASLWYLDHEEDTGRALSWKPSYEALVSRTKGASVIQKSSEHHAVFVKPPIPSDNRIFYMRGFATAAFFSRHVAERIARILNKFDGQIHHWAFHHPSRGVIDLVNKRLIKIGVEGLQLGWTPVSCNSSGSTIGLSLMRALQNAQPGQNIGIIGFGAGATFSCGVIRVIE